MTKKIHLKDKITSNLLFSEDVRNGLDERPRRLSSKWFYDQRGDELFQQIMEVPEYYLTNAEREIFQEQAAEFLAATNGEPFDLIELGAGDGSKTQYLIEHFVANGADFRYLPIDISENALQMVGSLVNRRWPNLNFNPLQGDYFSALRKLPSSGESSRIKMALFPGANIGNLTPDEAANFLRKLNELFNRGDLLVTGFDLKKDPDKILAAYNDASGATRDFNLNLLKRINRELDGDFDLGKWKHWPSYNAVTGATRSCIVSTCKQRVTIGALSRTYDFEAWEAIDLEISQKYSRQDIESLASETGFTHESHLTDTNGYFVDSIWRKA